MSLEIGIVGLANVGKSTLFNALVKAEQAEIGNYPFTTIDPNVAIVSLSDEKLDKLKQILVVEKDIPTAIKFVDIAGLIKGAHKGEGLGNQFLDQINRTQAILVVLRVFKNESATFDNISPKDQLAIILEEFQEKDRTNLIRLIEELEHKVKIQDEEAQEQLEISQKLVQLIDENEDLSNFFKYLNKNDRQFVKKLNLLLLKPRLLIINVNENEVLKKPTDLGFKNDEAMVVSARTEKELNGLNESEQKEYLGVLGIKKSALEKIINHSYKLLNLITFYTYKPKESVQAWSLKHGRKILAAASKIHTDFAHNFIRAEVINVQDLLKFESMDEAAHHGKVRAKGKDYTVSDGDLIYILHS